MTDRNSRQPPTNAEGIKEIKKHLYYVVSGCNNGLSGLGGMLACVNMNDLPSPEALSKLGRLIENIAALANKAAEELDSLNT